MEKITINKKQLTEAMADATMKVLDTMDFSLPKQLATILLNAVISAEMCKTLFKEEKED